MFRKLPVKLPWMVKIHNKNQDKVEFLGILHALSLVG
jgi:hypothetical protein